MADAKRIGFVDYKLDNFHANTYLAAFREKLKGRGYTVAGCYANEEAEGKVWTAKKDVRYFSDPHEMNEHVDFYCVLAPSHPQTHLDLCRKVMPFGKPTYVDKTFAPDLKTAKEIFELADQHRTAVQTSSALRYTDVQKKVQAHGKQSLKHMIAWGAGSSFAEYAIHPLEMVISCMGAECQSLMRRGTGEYSQILLNFSHDRTAVVNVYTTGDTPFAAALTTAKTTEYVKVDQTTLFTNMAAGILDFFDQRQALVDRSESLMIRRILDVCADPRALEESVTV
ncbi:MAG TPA: Gfo/Idh/MocA family oxidoreductase [Tepidisphaeraceae bacterium]|jgi:predicted dehydrogenase